MRSGRFGVKLPLARTNIIDEYRWIVGSRWGCRSDRRRRSDRHPHRLPTIHHVEEGVAGMAVSELADVVVEKARPSTWGENLPYAHSPYAYRRRTTHVVMVG